MTHKKASFLLFILAVALLLSGCTGGAAAIANSWPGMLVEQDSIFVAYNQHIYAIDLASRSEKWRFPVEPDAKITFYAQPLLTTDGQLIAAGYDHILYSLNPQTGAENWSFKDAKNRYIANPIQVGDLILAASADNHLYALDLSGKLAWSFETQGANWATPATNERCDCVYLTSMDHHVYSVDAGTGKQIWQSADLGGAIVGKPAYSPDGILYVGTFASEMIAFQAESGDILWRTATSGWVWGGPAFVDGVLYFGDLKGTVYALDAARGTQIWQSPVDGPVSETPLVKDGSIYVTTQTGTLYALDGQGAVKWSQAVGGKLYTAPALVDDQLLVPVTGKDELLFAYNTAGTQAWSYAIPKK